MFRNEVTRLDAIAAILCIESSMTISAIIDSIGNALHSNFTENPDEESPGIKRLGRFQLMQNLQEHGSILPEVDAMKARDRTFGPKTSFKTLVPVDDMMDTAGIFWTKTSFKTLVPDDTMVYKVQVCTGDKDMIHYSMVWNSCAGHREPSY
ncbi:hypothetical protein Gohar_003938, partial [Gossypium harknessii]|nr:hypothetical protein [Gossypium harknessii]